MKPPRGLRPLGGILQGMMRRGKFAEKWRQAQIQAAWVETVGPKAGENARPVSLKDGRLLVGVTSSVWSQELLFDKERILEGLRKRLKDEPLVDVRFKVGDRKSKRKSDKEGKP